LKGALVAGLLFAAGCGSGNRFIADRHDYALYRETRLARDIETRFAASQRYLRDEPSGRFREEVLAWFNRAEPRFFALGRNRPSILRAYLRALPDGPHAAAAQARLEEFGILNQYRAEREAQSERFISRVEGELERAETGRKAVISELTTLARLLAATRSFGRPTSELDHELIYRFRLQPPAGVCLESICHKEFRIPYAVPAGKKLAPREAYFLLSITLARGLVERLSVSGPELFSRIAEAVDRQPISASDMQARAEAIGRSVQVLENAVEAALPAAECRRDVLAPVVLERRCRGVRWRMVAALELGGDDHFEIEPETR
jgi:hypothetical protein